MLRRWFTWVVPGAVIAVGVLAGLDALRSSDGETTAPSPTAPTSTLEAREPPPPCTRLQVRVSIEILGGAAKPVVKNVGLSPCRLRSPLDLAVTISDQAGKKIHKFSSASFVGDFAPGQWATTPEQFIKDCQLHGPFQVVARVGPYTARRSNLTASQVLCLSAS
jgi:hypothetical protein